LKKKVRELTKANSDKDAKILKMAGVIHDYDIKLKLANDMLKSF
jgi:hypothetical protein